MGQPPVVTGKDCLAKTVPIEEDHVSTQKLTHGYDLFRHLYQFLLAAHGLAAHQGVSLFFVAAFHLHQQTLGQFDALALGLLLVAGMQLGAQGLVALEASHGHIENWLQALCVNAFDNVGANP